MQKYLHSDKNAKATNREKIKIMSWIFSESPEMMKKGTLFLTIQTKGKSVFKSIVVLRALPEKSLNQRKPTNKLEFWRICTQL